MTSELEKVSYYANRGRRLQHLSLKDLQIALIQALGSRLTNVWSPPALQLTDDIGSKFQLRGIDVRHHLVEDELLALNSKMAAGVLPVRSSTPAGGLNDQNDS